MQEIDSSSEKAEVMPLAAAPSAASPSARGAARAIGFQAAGEPCPTCGGPGESAADDASARPPTFVYALGRIEPRFPTLAVEKEFAQATGRADTAGKTDREAFHTVLSQEQSRYLARQLCWVFTIEGLDVYILHPQDAAQLALLTEAIRPQPSPLDIDIVIGVLGPIAPPTMCNGLLVPIVVFSQIYSFDRDALVKAIPRPEKVAAKEFSRASGELFERILQLTDNAGATDDHRAVNYLAVRYPAIYAMAAERFADNASLSEVQVRPSRLAGTRNVVDVIFTYTNRSTDVADKFFCRVDVTEEFPFLVTKLSPYYDR